MTAFAHIDKLTEIRNLKQTANIDFFTAVRKDASGERRQVNPVCKR